VVVLFFVVMMAFSKPLLGLNCRELGQIGTVLTG
jgi:hypothetical protein